MKIRYEKWTCLGCGNSINVTARDGLFLPKWLRISSETLATSGSQPHIQVSVCSTKCLKSVDKKIQKVIEETFPKIREKEHNIVTICDHCGKFVSCDLNNPLCGGLNPLRDWCKSDDGKIKRDYCSEECKTTNALKPADSVFFGVDSNRLANTNFIIAALHSENFEQALKAPRDPKRKGFYIE